MASAKIYKQASGNYSSYVEPVVDDYKFVSQEHTTKYGNQHKIPSEGNFCPFFSVFETVDVGGFVCFPLYSLLLDLIIKDTTLYGFYLVLMVVGCLL